MKVKVVTDSGASMTRLEANARVFNTSQNY